MDWSLAGGLRAWLEDGVVGAATAEVGAIVVRDGALTPRPPAARRIGLRELQACLSRVTFRLTVSDGPQRHPFEDALCATSVTERGPLLLDAVRHLTKHQRAALRATLRAVAATTADCWLPVPRAWLPRTGERLRVPLAGGAVVLSSTADLVLGLPSDGTASVCAVRVHDERDGLAGAGSVVRPLRALALAETLRSGARPWRVASFDVGTGQLLCEDADEALLVAAVGDVLRAIKSVNGARAR
ncbi:MAG: hypothetical protein ACRDXC_05590 [Acidimicrobiales bacterium]